MNWLIDYVASKLYARSFRPFNFHGGFVFSWATECEDVKESWRKEARRLVYFWRKGPDEGGK